MKKRILAAVAVLLMLAMLLSGCSGFYDRLQFGNLVAFSDMEYVRPDVAVFRAELEKTLEQAKTEKDVDALMKSVNNLYIHYYDFTTNYFLAQIHYSKDMRDIYWTEEYNWCMENSAQMSAGMDRLLYALAQCPLREELEGDTFFGADFFDQYDGESLWDETFTQMMERESALLEEYYDASARALEVEYYSEAYFTGCGLELEQTFVELVALRQQIAEYAGYESYPDFAYEFYYQRDYTPDEAQVYLDGLKEELVGLYLGLDADYWEPAYESCTQEQTLAYVKACAEALGGVAADAFRLMEKGQLYDITYSEYKYNASYEAYLYNYWVPYIFVCPNGTKQDQLTFVHEFGHFCNDYAANPSQVGIDVAEVFSQGLEYLSLFYCEDTQDLTRMKLADSLCVFVEQSAYASFELAVYDLAQDALTVEAVRKIYGEVCEDYGFAARGRDSRDYTLIPHLFISPLYVISYVVSNDAAMQIYQMEQETPGSGAKLWEDSLFTTQMGYLGFVKEAGLQNPFQEGRAEQLRKMFAEKLK